MVNVNEAFDARAQRKRSHIGLIILGVLTLAVVILIAAWNWDWFIPIVERQASGAIGRAVTMQHLRVHLARNPVVEVDGLRIANPEGFPQDSALAQVGQLAVTVDAPAYLHTRAIVIPTIELDRAEVDPVQRPDGSNNWTLKSASSSAQNADPSAGPKIGDLRISDSHVHALLAKLKADFVLDVSTDPSRGDKSLLADIHGTYAGQPIKGNFAGGALVSLRDGGSPYPVTLSLANGPTKVNLDGTVEDPMAFKGANIELDLAGPNLALLTPLTGIPLPETPAFRLSGRLDYQDQRVRFRDFSGTVGKSDLEGTIAVDPAPQRPKVDLDLRSKRVDLVDLGGFIGAPPKNAKPGSETAEQKQEQRAAANSSKLLPDTPINLPKLQFADVDLRYRGERIEGRSIPLDNLTVAMTIKDGAVSLHPVSFGVGKGEISSQISLEPRDQSRLHATVATDFRQVDVSRLLAATHAFGGAGTIGGHADVVGNGNSVATILGDGQGSLRLFMSGGDLSALLVDLSGLEFGNALLSALGLPQRTQVRCLISDFALQNGLVTTRTFLLDTEEAQVHGSGTLSLKSEKLDLQLKTESKHFSIGSLPGPIDIGGTFKNPSIGPGAETVARAGAAVGLGILLTPLGALLPTIQFGTGDDAACAQAIHPVQRTPPSGGNRITHP